MTGFILRRLLYTLVVMLIASIAIFYWLRVAPGDPVNAILNPTAHGRRHGSELARGSASTCRVYQQYFVFLGHVFTGDFGVSLVSGKPIPELIGSYGLRTLVLGDHRAADRLQDRDPARASWRRSGTTRSGTRHRCSSRTSAWASRASCWRCS